MQLLTISRVSYPAIHPLKRACKRAEPDQDTFMTPFAKAWLLIGVVMIVAACLAARIHNQRTIERDVRLNVKLERVTSLRAGEVCFNLRISNPTGRGRGILDPIGFPFVLKLQTGSTSVPLIHRALAPSNMWISYAPKFTHLPPGETIRYPFYLPGDFVTPDHSKTNAAWGSLITANSSYLLTAEIRSDGMYYSSNPVLVESRTE